jgi:quinoprotein glucose dehydrogenase
VVVSSLNPDEEETLVSLRPILLAAFWLCLMASIPAPADSTRSPGRFYTQEQASHGAAVFERACASCHSVNRSDLSPVGLSGGEVMKKWHSVAGLYHKSRWTMPADRILELDVDAQLAVTAYLLEQNGFPPGETPLLEDVRAMKGMLLAPVASDAEAAPGGSAAGFYTAAQAKRGKAYFAGSCATCHLAEPPIGAESERSESAFEPGVRMGSELIVMPLMGQGILKYRHSVSDLFLKTRTTMPIEYPDALSEQSYLDIVAYLLQAKGFPAGERALVADLEAMRSMTLPESGFEMLFNGRDFTGLRFLLGHGCQPRPQGCGATDPGTTFRIHKGAIHNSGRPSGYMYTEKKFLDFTLRLDLRYVPYAGMDSDAEYYSNTGILLFVTEHRVWPKSLEIQGMYPAALSILPIDTEPVFTTDAHARRAAMLPPGEWNAIEIVSRSGEVRVSLNGRLVTTVTEHEFEEPGHIGFQSEGAEVYLSNIRIREE